jgi:hypothetical protein
MAAPPCPRYFPYRECCNWHSSHHIKHNIVIGFLVCYKFCDKACRKRGEMAITTTRDDVKEAAGFFSCRRRRAPHRPQAIFLSLILIFNSLSE